MDSSKLKDMRDLVRKIKNDEDEEAVALALGATFSEVLKQGIKIGFIFGLGLAMAVATVRWCIS